MRKLLLTMWLLTLAESACAGVLSFAGNFATANPNDVFLVPFTLTVNAGLHIQTYGYGGTANAAAGENAVGVAIAAGGFDPYISLFAGTGPGATFLASNDDGLCPPGTAAPVCADSTLDMLNLVAGNYTLALTLPFNFSFAENNGISTLGDGFIGLDSDFSDGACAASCTANYAFDITSAQDLSLISTPVPTSGSLALILLGLLMWACHIYFLKGRSKCIH
jgi:hypothetical protein